MNITRKTTTRTAFTEALAIRGFDTKSALLAYTQATRALAVDYSETAAERINSRMYTSHLASIKTRRDFTKACLDELFSTWVALVNDDAVIDDEAFADTEDFLEAEHEYLTALYTLMSVYKAFQKDCFLIPEPRFPIGLPYDVAMDDEVQAHAQASLADAADEYSRALIDLNTLWEDRHSAPQCRIGMQEAMVGAECDFCYTQMQLISRYCHTK